MNPSAPSIKQLPPLAQPHRAELTETEAKAGATTITQSRLIAAPRDLVWLAWTDPLQLGQWWGPRGFSVTTDLFAFRAGGSWKFTMHGPDPDPSSKNPGGPRDFPNHIVYDAIDQQQAVWRMEYHHVSADGAPPMHFLSVVTFEETTLHGKPATRLVLSSDFGSEAFRDQLIRDYGASQGGRETLARLADHTEGTGMAATQAALGHRLVLTRDLPVPRALVWRCWTEPELIKQWFCPKPWQVTEVDNDLRAGGRANNVMEGPGPDGKPMRNVNTGSYLEVIPGEKLVFTDLLLEDWTPNAKTFLGFTAAVTFEDIGNGHCRYTAVCKHPTQASQEQHARMGFHEGWGVATDQLVALAQQLAS